jgi:hypothetical protein
MAHAFPKEISQAELVADSLERLWLLPPESKAGQSPVAFYDPATPGWRTFPSFGDALINETKRRPVFASRPHGFNRPVFDQRGRIAVLTSGWKLDYFDGTIWHHWLRKDIRGDNRPFLSQPRFDTTGKLCVNAENETWYYAPETGWRQGNLISKDWQSAPPVNLSREVGIEDPDSAVLDNEQTIWFTRRGQLFKCRSKRFVQVFGGNERHPFIDRRPIKEAFVDENGNAFFKTIAAGRIEYVQVAPRLPMPRTKIRLAGVADDNAVLAFTNKATGKAVFQWRIDAGEWRETDEKANIDALSNGLHTVEAIATNEELRVEKSPARLQFTMAMNTRGLVTRLVRQLATDIPEDRENAVVALVKRPTVALPALKAARKTASDDHRWWIDATIQEIERRTKTITNKPQPTPNP